MAFKTYSFEDVIGTFEHKGAGGMSTSGAGIGSISVAMAGDRTAHDVAADGHVMISKMPGPNGSLTITVQQTSEVHKFLIKWYNYVNIAPASEWATMILTVSSNNLGDNIACTGVSPQKMADRGYEAQGGMATWNLMAAEITHK